LPGQLPEHRTQNSELRKLTSAAQDAILPHEGRWVMSMEMVRSALLWCTVINYTFLLIWFLLYVLPHGWLYRIWGRWFHLTHEQFDALNFGGIVLYKAGIMLFNLAPLVALYLAG